MRFPQVCSVSDTIGHVEEKIEETFHRFSHIEESTNGEESIHISEHQEHSSPDEPAV